MQVMEILIGAPNRDAKYVPAQWIANSHQKLCRNVTLGAPNGAIRKTNVLRLDANMILLLVDAVTELGVSH